MTYKMENIKLAIATVLAVVLVISPLIIGYQASQFPWGVGFSFVALLTIKLFYECGEYDGAPERRATSSFNPYQIVRGNRTMNVKHVALIAIAVSCLSLAISSFGILHRKAVPSFTVIDPSIRIWFGKTEDGNEAVCINGFAYEDGTIFEDRLLVPMTGVRADESGPDNLAKPAQRAVRCKS